MKNVVIQGEDSRKLTELLVTYLSDTGAKSVVLVSRSGFILSQAGDFSGVNVNSLAVLATAGLSSTQALASALGEKKFAATSYQGTHQNLHIHSIMPEAFIVAIADTGITSSVVRLYSREISNDLIPILNSIFA